MPRNEKILCLTAGENSCPCVNYEHYQQGGGWTSHSFIQCSLFGRVRVKPDCAGPPPAYTALEEILVPDSCPFKARQMDIYDLLEEAI